MVFRVSVEARHIRFPLSSQFGAPVAAAVGLLRQQLAEHAAMRNWHYLDLWDLVPSSEFTNSAIHLTPAGERLLADKILEAIQAECK